MLDFERGTEIWNESKTFDNRNLINFLQKMQLKKQIRLADLVLTDHRVSEVKPVKLLPLR